jgi:hypothetical protein
MRAFPRSRTTYLKKTRKHVKRLFGKARILLASPCFCGDNGAVPSVFVVPTAAFGPLSWFRAAEGMLWNQRRSRYRQEGASQACMPSGMPVAGLTPFRGVQRGVTCGGSSATGPRHRYSRNVGGHRGRWGVSVDRILGQVPITCRLSTLSCNSLNIQGKIGEMGGGVAWRFRATSGT